MAQIIPGGAIGPVGVEAFQRSAANFSNSMRNLQALGQEIQRVREKKADDFYTAVIAPKIEKAGTATLAAQLDQQSFQQWFDMMGMSPKKAVASTEALRQGQMSLPEMLQNAGIQFGAGNVAAYSKETQNAIATAQQANNPDILKNQILILEQEAESATPEDQVAIAQEINGIKNMLGVFDMKGTFEPTEMGTTSTDPRYRKQMTKQGINFQLPEMPKAPGSPSPGLSVSQTGYSPMNGSGMGQSYTPAPAPPSPIDKLKSMQSLDLQKRQAQSPQYAAPQPSGVYPQQPVWDDVARKAALYDEMQRRQAIAGMAGQGIGPAPMMAAGSPPTMQMPGQSSVPGMEQYDMMTGGQDPHYMAAVGAGEGIINAVAMQQPGVADLVAQLNAQYPNPAAEVAPQTVPQMGQAPMMARGGEGLMGWLDKRAQGAGAESWKGALANPPAGYERQSLGQRIGGAGQSLANIGSRFQSQAPQAGPQMYGPGAQYMYPRQQMPSYADGKDGLTNKELLELQARSGREAQAALAPQNILEPRGMDATQLNRQEDEYLSSEANMTSPGMQPETSLRNWYDNPYGTPPPDEIDGYKRMRASEIGSGNTRHEINPELSKRYGSIIGNKDYWVYAKVIGPDVEKGEYPAEAWAQWTGGSSDPVVTPEPEPPVEGGGGEDQGTGGGGGGTPVKAAKARRWLAAHQKDWTGTANPQAAATMLNAFFPDGKVELMDFLSNPADAERVKLGRKELTESARQFDESLKFDKYIQSWNEQQTALAGEAMDDYFNVHPEVWKQVNEIRADGDRMREKIAAEKKLSLDDPKLDELFGKAMAEAGKMDNFNWASRVYAEAMGVPGLGQIMQYSKDPGAMIKFWYFLGTMADPKKRETLKANWASRQEPDYRMVTGPSVGGIRDAEQEAATAASNIRGAYGIAPKQTGR